MDIREVIMTLELDRSNNKWNTWKDGGRLSQAQKQLFCRVLWALFLGSLYAATALSQGATVVGRVTDPSEGILAKVEITATNVDTGISTTTFTNEEGYYALPYLPVGRYTVAAQLAGFSKGAEDRSRAPSRPDSPPRHTA